MKIISVKKFRNKKYKEIPFEGLWRDSFGVPEARCSMLVYGQPKNGKTEFCVKLANYISTFGKVLYISKEQGMSHSLQICFKRNEVSENVFLGVDYDFKDILNALKKSFKAVIIDSIDYFKMNVEEVQILLDANKKTIIIFVSWGEGKKPMSKISKKTEFMVDAFIQVEKYVAFSFSRFGGGNPFVIWEKEAKKHHSFLNR